MTIAVIFFKFVARKRKNNNMNNFTYQNTTRIHFGKGQIARLERELMPYHKIMLLYGGGSIKQNGVYHQVMQQLKAKQVIEFGGIEANPRYETLMKAVGIARTEQVDFLLAVGGGSVIDGTKFVAAAIPFDAGDPWTILSEYAKFTKALPLGTVLTLPATGSEMNGNAVITREEYRMKLAFGNKMLLPVFSVLDPETMYSLPSRQLANGVADAFVHVMEQYLTYHVNSPVQDRFAEALLLTLIEQGPALLRNPKDYDTCANVMWAATMALNGLIVAGVPDDWATHMIGHELTALHGVDHGQSLCIVLPGVMNQLREQKRGKLLQFAQRVWNIKKDDEQKGIDDAIAATEGFFNSLGIATRLGEYGISPADVDYLCSRLEARDIHWGECKNVDAECVKKILIERL